MAASQTVRAADYIIIGAGSAGCVIANRLSARRDIRVLLIEAGGDDRMTRNPGQFASNFKIYMPAGYGALLGDKRVTWDYTTEPDPATGGRSHKYPRGKVLGGSSAINGLMYVRGFPADYDGWQKLGCHGWGWEEVLPLFRRIEKISGRPDALQGDNGCLAIADYPSSPIMDSFISACIEAGLPPTANINGAIQEGASYSQQTTHNGHRASSARAYLHPVLSRSNLHLEADALVTRILFEGRRATGIEYRKAGVIKRAFATREVILCGGAINSPHLLELSGIGNAQLLRQFGIPVVADLGGVGENLQDHFCVAMQARLTPGSPSLNAKLSGLALVSEGLKFLFQRRGLLTLSVCAATGYLRSSSSLPIPDTQFMAIPATIDAQGSASSGRTLLEKQPGFTIGGYLTHPQSRGSVHLSSPDQAIQPLIRLNYLATTSDETATMNMLRAFRNILRQPSMARMIENKLPPFARLDNARDAQLLDHARNTGFTAYHPVGTCRMGTDQHSVVDPDLRVRGIAGLRIADASIMPELVSGNTNAACLMIGEKASELILQEPHRNE